MKHLQGAKREERDQRPQECGQHYWFIQITTNIKCWRKHILITRVFILYYKNVTQGRRYYMKSTHPFSQCRTSDINSSNFLPLFRSINIKCLLYKTAARILMRSRKQVSTFAKKPMLEFYFSGLKTVVVLVLHIY